MKAVKIIILVLIVVFLCVIGGCFRHETDRYALIETNRLSATLRSEGVILSPITPEGSFPKVNHVLHLSFSNPLPISGSQTYRIGEGCNCKFNYATNGEIEFDFDNGQAVVDLSYSGKYWWNHNGKMRIVNSPNKSIEETH